MYKRYTAEEIIHKLQRTNVLLGQSGTISALGYRPPAPEIFVPNEDLEQNCKAG